jgi:DNA-binding transcriptional regulator YhcF (GntR family)
MVNGFRYLLAACDMMPPDDATSVKLVLISIVRHRNSRTGLCCPSIQRLMLLTGFTKRTILRATKTLRDLGILSWERGYGHGVSNRYTINLPELEAYRVDTRQKLL